MSVADLSQKISFLDLLEWKMHWLACELDNRLDDFKRQVTDRRRTLEAVQEAESHYVNTLKHFHKAIWEAATMFMCDYHATDVYPGLQDSPKHKRLVESLAKFKAWVIETQLRINDSELKRINESLRELSAW